MPIGEDFKEDLENNGVRESAEKAIEDKDVPAVKKVLSETVPEMPDDISLMESWDLGKYLGLYLSAPVLSKGPSRCHPDHSRGGEYWAMVAARDASRVSFLM